MGTTLIKVNCLDQRLIITSAPAVASGGRNEDDVEFSFCPLWSGFVKTAVFYRSEDDVYHAQLNNDRCTIPHEVLAEDGVLYFGVFGVNGTVTRTSEIIKYRVVKGALTTGTRPTEPTPDIYTQLLSRLATIEAFTVPADPYVVAGGLVQVDNFEGMPMNCVTVVDPIREGSGDPFPGGSSKNLLNFPDVGEKTYAGVVWSCSGGAVSAVGTASAQSYTSVSSVGIKDSPKLSPGTYKAVGHSDIISIVVVITESGTDKYYSGGATFTIDDTHVMKSVYCQVKKNAVVNETIRPMIVKSDETDLTYVPYENVRPIHGRTAANLMRCGKNLLPYPYDFSADIANHYGLRIVTDSNGRITITGTVAGTGDAGAAYVTPLNASRKYHLPVGKYRLFSTPSGGGLETYRTNVRTYKLDGTQIANMGDTGNGCKFEVTEGTAYIDVYISVAEGCTVNGLVFSPMIIPDDGSATTFEPYKGGTFRAEFGRTVYGGTVDWHKGVLTIDRGLYTCTGEELVEDRQNIVGDTYKYRITPSGLAIKWPMSSTELSGVVCSHYLESAYQPQYFSAEQSVALHPDGYVTIRTDKASTEAFSAWLAEQYTAGKPVQICVPLKTPITVQFTPRDVIALHGLNNVWSDSGETTVSGRKDVFWFNNYLQEQIAYLMSAVNALSTAAAVTE